MWAFLAGCAMLSVSGWLRPPMGRDIPATSIPLFSRAGGETLELVEPGTNAPQLRVDSVGTVLLLLVGAGLVVVLVRPGRFRLVCGVLLSAAWAGNAAVCWNHPAVIESLEFELEQSHRIRGALTGQYETSLAQRAVHAKRIARRPDGEHRSDVAVGGKYLQHGVWLTALAAAGVFVAGSGGWPQRVGCVVAWTALGVVLAEAVCFERLRGELLWWQACRHEQAGQFDLARKSAERAVEIFPPFAELTRTWCLIGRLDYRQGAFSPQRHFFQLSQWVESCTEPSVAAAAADLAELADGSPPRPVLQLACDALCDEGLRRLGERQFAAAEAHFQRASRLMPERWDAPVLMAVSHASSGRSRPADTTDYLRPLLPRLRDRALKAELWSTLGDVHFQSGEFELARNYYDESLKQFHLPKIINHRALKGLMGL